MIQGCCFERLRVLIVDDNRFMRSLIATILHAFQIKNVVEAEDAMSAFQILRSFSADLIVTDLHMPMIDGIEFVRLLRTAQDSKNPHVPIVMLTGFSDVQNVVTARDAGVNAFLAKPVSARSLYSKIVFSIENPQPFIRSKMYVGPDRRRRSCGPPEGLEERRAGNNSERFR